MNCYLLLTKNFPPQNGGIEKYASDLKNALILEGNFVYVINASPRNIYLLEKSSAGLLSNSIYLISEFRRLLFFLFRCLIFGPFKVFLWIIGSREISKGKIIIWPIDGSIAWIGFLVGLISKVVLFFFCFRRDIGKILFTRVTCHGKDVTWNNCLYQHIFLPFIHHMDEIYVISMNTLQECIKKKIPMDQIQFVPHTLDTLTFLKVPEFNKKIFLGSLNITKKDGLKILFSIGRFIERKGLHWFLSEVVPKLNQGKFHYIIAGSGPYFDQYNSIISIKKLSNVTILRQIDDVIKGQLYLSSDFFIMPNISVEGDVEGFGLVLLEAQFYSLKCLVADIDGMRNLGLKNVQLIPEKNTDLWVDSLNKI